MIRSFTVAMVLAAFAGSAMADETQIDPKKHHWAKFGVGSWAKIKSVSVMDMAGNKTETITEQTHTLVELNENEAIVEVETVTTMTVGGNEIKQPPQKTKMPYPLKAQDHPKGEHPKTDVKSETGEEVLEMAGQKLKCSWFKATSEQNGMKSTSKSWSCEDVPGFFVKSESKTEGQANISMTSELVGYEVK